MEVSVLVFPVKFGLYSLYRLVRQLLICNYKEKKCHLVGTTLLRVDFLEKNH